MRGQSPPGSAAFLLLACQRWDAVFLLNVFLSTSLAVSGDCRSVSILCQELLIQLDAFGVCLHPRDGQLVAR